jgi:hypothetical protein
METPLLTDVLHYVIIELDKIILHRGIGSVLLELESLMGHVVIYETLHFTTSKGLVGLKPSDYPILSGLPGDVTGDVGDLPLLKLLRHVGGFALLWASHYRLVTAPYSSLLLSESEGSRDAQVILDQVIANRPSNKFNLPPSSSKSDHPFYNHHNLVTDSTSAVAAANSFHGFASLDSVFLNSFIPIDKRGSSTLRKLWTTALGCLKRRIENKPGGTYGHPGSYLVFVFDRASESLRSVVSFRRTRRKALHHAGAAFQFRIISEITKLGFGISQLEGLGFERL